MKALALTINVRLHGESQVLKCVWECLLQKQRLPLETIPPTFRIAISL